MFTYQKIRECRDELGLSQEDLMIELANRGCRVSRPTLTRWETGDSIPDANELAVIAMFFRKPVKYFFVN